MGSGAAWVTHALSGDATLAAGGALTLATVNANVGTFGSAAAVPVITVNAKGLITAVTTATVNPFPPDASVWFGVIEPIGLVTTPPQAYGITNTTSGTPAVNALATGLFLDYTAGGTATSVAGWATALTSTETLLQPYSVYTVRTGAVLTNMRIWIGLASKTVSAGGLGDTDTPGATNAVHGLLFRSSSVAGDTNWQVVTCNGATDTVTSSGVAIAASTVYVFTIDALNPASVKFYINGVLVATIATTLPSTTTTLAMLAQLYNTLGVGGHVISLAKFYIRAQT